jgi:hypothetical protein
MDASASAIAAVIPDLVGSVIRPAPRIVQSLLSRLICVIGNKNFHKEKKRESKFAK